MRKKLTPKQREIRHRAIEVAAYHLGLWLQEQRIKAGEDSYKRMLSADANPFERLGNEHALRKGSIVRQTAAKFGIDEKQVARDIERVKREGWTNEVLAELGEKPRPASIVFRRAGAVTAALRNPRVRIKRS
jgi:hypothetical protein